MQIRPLTIQVLDVEPAETVKDLKLRLQEALDLSSVELKLLFLETELEDSQTLAECGIEAGAQIQLVIHCEITIFVRTMTGKRLPVKLPSDASAELLMSRLTEEVASECHLLFCGRPVVGKICDHGIKEGDELVACVRHRIQ
eukprot:Skav219733  [mRNA]  locus=scaffold301:392856:393551:- [translate_table: standard]